MTWLEARRIYPQKWLLIEAVDAHTEADKRILDQIAIIGLFDDGQNAWQTYAQLRKEQPQREMIIIHTSREDPDITVRSWTGLRGLG